MSHTPSRQHAGAKPHTPRGPHADHHTAHGHAEHAAPPHATHVLQATPRREGHASGGHGSPRSAQKSRPGAGNTVGRNQVGLSLQSAQYQPFISKEEAAAGIKRGQLIQGQLRINVKRATDAYVSGGKTYSNDILISGMIDRNRSLDGDLVVVQLRDRCYWSVLEQDIADKSLAQSLLLGTQAPEKHADSRSALTGVFGIQLSNIRDDFDEKTLLSSNIPQPQKIKFLQITTDGCSEKVCFILFDNQGNAQKTEQILRNQISDPRVRFATPTISELLEFFKSEIPDKFLRPVGKVVHIAFNQPNRQIIGTLQLMKNSDGQGVDQVHALLYPSDPKLPFVVVDCPSALLQNPKSYNNLLMVGTITLWSEQFLFPFGTVVSNIGVVGDINAETQAILAANSIDATEYSEELCATLPQSTVENPWKPSQEEISKRRDLRSVVICTIDPPTARDLDDALSCVALPNGNFDVGVHIADVSHFVTGGSEIDEIAKRRATTTYLVQQCYPMLPRLLSEQLCSLNGGEERYAFSIGWELTPEGEIVSEWAGKTVIKSSARMTYDHAQRIIENPNLEWDETMPHVYEPHTIQQVKDSVLNLQALAVKMRAKRFENGALRLDNTKLVFRLDENGLPALCQPYIIKDSNKLVEEFMLLTNMASARRIYNAFPDHALLRRHPNPSQKKLDQAKNRLNECGVDVNVSSAHEIHLSLQKIQKERSLSDYYVVQHILTQPMQTALYFSTGSVEIEDFGHYALAVPYYTHFTSPIRRYADVIVHRLLQASIVHNEENPLDNQQVNEIAFNCNQRKSAAKKASDESQSLFLWAYLNKVGNMIEKAVVLDVLDYSFDILVLRLGIQLRVNLQLQEDELTYSDDHSKISIFWKSDNLQQDVSLFTVVHVNLKPYRRDIRPDVQCRLLRPTEQVGEQAEIHHLIHKMRSSLEIDEVD